MIDRPPTEIMDRSDPDYTAPRDPFVKDDMLFVPAFSTQIGSAEWNGLRYGMLLVAGSVIGGFFESMTTETMRKFAHGMLDEADRIDADNKSVTDAQLAETLRKTPGSAT